MLSPLLQLSWSIFQHWTATFNFRSSVQKISLLLTSGTAFDVLIKVNSQHKGRFEAWDRNPVRVSLLSRHWRIGQSSRIWDQIDIFKRRSLGSRPARRASKRISARLRNTYTAAVEHLHLVAVAFNARRSDHEPWIFHQEEKHSDKEIITT